MKSYKEYAKELFDGINNGITEIIDKYNTLIGEKKEYYDEEKKKLSPKYITYKNNAATKARNDLNNIRYSLAEKGLSSSGESLTALLSNSAALQDSLSSLDASHESERNELERQKNEEISKLEAEKLNTSESLKSNAYKSLLDYETKDRELSLKEKQEENDQKNKEADIKIKEAYLELEKQNSNKDEPSSDKTITPSESPKQIIDYLESKYTNFDWENGETPDKAKVTTAIRKLLGNSNLSLQYRYELDLYAKILGYI